MNELVRYSGGEGSRRDDDRRLDDPRAQVAAAPQPVGRVEKAGRGRLTDVERAERRMNQAELQDLITDLAVIHGWEWLHVRPGMKANGRWWTATTGTLSRWPDLVLVRVRDRRLIFAELTKELGAPTGDQMRVLDVLQSLVFNRYTTSPALGFNCLLLPQVEVHVWRPSDLRDPIQDSVIGRTLR